ncbi:MAG: hypothetical protein GKR94_03385 [Gammaproteobacteria bacterium]|nr:hypothetical protein [Gammaproteobacteria bacterium]
MKVKVYKAKRSDSSGSKVFLLIASQSSLESVPADILEQVGDMVPFRDFELLPGQQRIALDTDEALKAIDEEGYYIQGAKIEFATGT